jgi:hypothetical protein
MILHKYRVAGYMVSDGGMTFNDKLGPADVANEVNQIIETFTSDFYDERIYLGN